MEHMTTADSGRGQPQAVGSSDGLGLLPEPFVDDYFWLTPDGEQEVPLWDESQMRAYAAQEVAAEREACREIVEECIRTQAHLASNAREALSEASARIYKRGRA